MWIRSPGPKASASGSVFCLNNQYTVKKVSAIPGVTMYYADGIRRIEQCRYSWEQLKEDTGLGTEDVTRRLVDYGMEHYWQSHHPHIVPEPFTLEPTESYSKKDLDEFIAVLQQISWEAYNDPDIIRTAPHNAPVHGIKNYYETDPEKIMCSWRQYLKRRRSRHGDARFDHQSDRRCRRARRLRSDGEDIKLALARGGTLERCEGGGRAFGLVDLKEEILSRAAGRHGRHVLEKLGFSYQAVEVHHAPPSASPSDAAVTSAKTRSRLRCRWRLRASICSCSPEATAARDIYRTVGLSVRAWESRRA